MLCCIVLWCQHTVYTVYIQVYISFMVGANIGSEGVNLEKVWGKEVKIYFTCLPNQRLFCSLDVWFISN